MIPWFEIIPDDYLASFPHMGDVTQQHIHETNVRMIAGMTHLVDLKLPDTSSPSILLNSQSLDNAAACFPRLSTLIAG